MKIKHLPALILLVSLVVVGQGHAGESTATEPPPVLPWGEIPDEVRNPVPLPKDLEASFQKLPKDYPVFLVDLERHWPNDMTGYFSAIEKANQRLLEKTQEGDYESVKALRSLFDKFIKKTRPKGDVDARLYFWLKAKAIRQFERPEIGARQYIYNRASFVDEMNAVMESYRERHPATPIDVLLGSGVNDYKELKTEADRLKHKKAVQEQYEAELSEALFEDVSGGRDKEDAGPAYLRSCLDFDGNEYCLSNPTDALLAEKINKTCKWTGTPKEENIYKKDYAEKRMEEVYAAKIHFFEDEKDIVDFKFSPGDLISVIPSLDRVTKATIDDGLSVSAKSNTKLFFKQRKLKLTLSLKAINLIDRIETKKIGPFKHATPAEYEKFLKEVPAVEKKWLLNARFHVKDCYTRSQSDVAEINALIDSIVMSKDKQAMLKKYLLD